MGGFSPYLKESMSNILKFQGCSGLYHSKEIYNIFFFEYLEIISELNILFWDVKFKKSQISYFDQHPKGFHIIHNNPICVVKSD